MSRRQFERELAMRNVDSTVRELEEAVAEADGPTVGSLVQLLKAELAELRQTIEEQANDDR